MIEHVTKIKQTYNIHCPKWELSTCLKYSAPVLLPVMEQNEQRFS